MMDEELPEGWAEVPLSELLEPGGMFDGPFGSHLKTSDYTETGIRVVRLENLANLRFVEEKRAFISQPKYETLRKHTVVAGDILFGSFVDSDVRVCLVPPLQTPAIAKADCFCIRTMEDSVDRRFLVYQLAARATRDALVKEIHGVTRPRITTKQLRAFTVAVAPLVEQRRLAERIDALVAKVTTARRSLAGIPLILKRFRQSVLAAACTGKLTEDWRAKEHNTGDPARLLEGIREARLRAWEAAERRKLAIRGRTITDAELRARYRQPPEAEAAFETPASWAWATLDELTLLAGGVTKGEKRQAGAQLRIVPYLRVANVQRGHLDLTRIKSILATEDEINDLRLEYGDILLNEGGDIDKLGRGWVWHGEVAECIHQNHVFRARPVSALVEPHFVSHYANTFGQRFFFDAGSQTVNLASVSMSKIRGLPVPVPSVDEQREILRRVNALFGLADKIERRVAAASARGDVLTQSILAKAFRGELVPTEADLARAEGRDYESGDALVVRIHAERAVSAPPFKRRPHSTRRGARL
jgi:type I restriction enzyme S subunit